MSKKELANIKCYTIPIAAEFDCFRRDAMYLVDKLRMVGRYVDHGMYAGVHHLWFQDEECGENTEKFFQDMNYAFKAFVTGEEITDNIDEENVKPEFRKQVTNDSINFNFYGGNEPSVEKMMDDENVNKVEQIESTDEFDSPTKVKTASMWKDGDRK